jgi:hypothetical protein
VRSSAYLTRSSSAARLSLNLKFPRRAKSSESFVLSCAQAIWMKHTPRNTGVDDLNSFTFPDPECQPPLRCRQTIWIKHTIRKEGLVPRDLKSPELKASLHPTAWTPKPRP